MSGSGETSLLVHRVSDSFSELWPALAHELGVTLAEWTLAQGELPASDAAVLLIAAGGREAELVTRRRGGRRPSAR